MPKLLKNIFNRAIDVLNRIKQCLMRGYLTNSESEAWFILFLFNPNIVLQNLRCAKIVGRKWIKYFRLSKRIYAEHRYCSSLLYVNHKEDLRGYIDGTAFVKKSSTL